MKNIELILSKLRDMHGEPRCELTYGNALELAVATVLSAQCTDERVNRVTVSLFKKYRSLQDYIDAPLEILEEDIRPTGFYKNKAKNLKNIAREISERFKGHIPEDIDAFATIKGIGRKSANMIVGLAYKTPAVIVDTHVVRVSGRIGITGSSDPEKIEKDLKKATPECLWIDLSLLLILHGRYLCRAQKPECDRCLLQKECDHYNL
ncbi:MAG: endonuclease III [Proteobacteria bacterium]|nr:endonuclease III [Pseudomonadota bacterium]